MFKNEVRLKSFILAILFMFEWISNFFLTLFRIIDLILCIGPVRHVPAEVPFWAGDPRWEWQPLWRSCGAESRPTPSCIKPTWKESWLQELLLEDFYILLAIAIVWNSCISCMLVLFLFSKFIHYLMLSIQPLCMVGSTLLFFIFFW